MSDEKTATEEVQPQNVFENVADMIIDGQLPEAEETEVESQDPTNEEQVEADGTQPADETPQMHKVKVDGEEMEVSYEELVKGYQTSRHLTQKGQRLAEEERAIAAQQGILKHFENPDFVKHAMSYFEKPAQAEEAPPEDPIERIQWDAERAAMAKMQPELDQRDKDIKNIRREVDINKVLGTLAARDGQDFQVVHSNLEKFIRSKYPPAVADRVIASADADQKVFLDVYGEALKDLQAYKKSRATKSTKKTAANVPPVLEDPSVDVSDAKIAEKRKNLKKQRAAALSSGDPEALQQYFLDSGLIDSLA